ncbi:MAG: hypothetical protein AB8I08_26860 [Sandaracinaceae bacterium]
MTRTPTLLITAILLTLGLSGCYALPYGSGTGAGTGSAGGALLCEDLGTSAEAQRVEAFLSAGTRFEADTLALAADVEGTCEAIADDLGIAIPSAEEGDLQVEATCRAVAEEIAVIMETSMPTGATLDVRYAPAVCSFELDAMASCVAECDASFDAYAEVQCTEGQLVGSCEGTCVGECRVDGTSTEVHGACAGACAGSCDVAFVEPRCEGEAYVEADASCQAACDAQLTMRAECTEPELDMVASIDVDPVAQARLVTLLGSLDANYPRLLAAQAKLERAAESGADMVAAFEDAADAAGTLGMRASACFAGTTVGAAQSMGTVNVTLSVTVEVSASVSATAS